MKLEPPDCHSLSAATGWFELGNLKESKDELTRLSPTGDKHPDVLELRWAIAARENNWDHAWKLAEQLVAEAPERPSGWLHRAYAARRAPGGGLRQAWDTLLLAVEKFPDEPIISYNLSCYACQMDELDSARVWLKKAFRLGGREQIKRMALKDPDLEPLWIEIRKL